MFCPQCGSTHSDEIKFCKLCGANLQAVQQAMISRAANDKFDWSKTWVAEMFMSEGERKRRNEERDTERGITPEVKRYVEIKAGVITGSVGIALMIFLKFFMEGLIRSGKIPPDAIEILNRIWIAGVIPLFVGIALIINGVFVSKKMVEARKRSDEATARLAEGGPVPRKLGSPDTTEFVPAGFSVTEETTKHLGGPVRK
ncbi:MAG: hypothetical protein QOJ64_3066 [Acidobacteriota bacterium]|nr:hypothetical protein [Acidobacteriota bacterium]